MSLARVTTWTFLLASGFALSQSAANGQPGPLPNRNYDTEIINRQKTMIRGGISKKDLEETRTAFKGFAKYYADVIAHEAVWKASLELKADPKIPTIDSGENGILREIDRFLLDPVPGGIKNALETGRNAEPADYIREMGAALDESLRKLIETHPERIVRINAARVLAHVARTGAAAHFKTVTELLANPKTSTEIKYYMLQAAAGLLSAIDAREMTLRKHAAPPAVIGTLVKLLEDCVNKPTMLVPDFKAETATEDQKQVVSVVRRQAVRALAQVKFVRIPGPDGKTSFLYPSYTLVRVAMSDPALNPAPSPAECAEAVIGICNMAPVEWQGDANAVPLPIKGYNSDLAVEAVMHGLVTFASPRAADRGNNLLPWRHYALRIAEALTKWRPLFDPNFDFGDPANYTNPARFDAKLIPPSLEELNRFAIPKVLAPLEQVDGSGRPVADPEVPGLRRMLADRQKLKRKTELFEGVKETGTNFEPKQ